MANLQQKTKSLKIQIYALYFGQDVLFKHRQTWNIAEDFLEHIKDSYLELKPISMISDEEAIALKHQDAKGALEYYNKWQPNAYDSDYLRSKGYATAYYKFSIEDLMNLGIIKLVGI